ncbi:50S ribosomal protein L5 [Candidatus Mycoplasma mahonii]|uniref:50S ribosomal protein L5 n=1 Tax=Candidatus Mycoplasma mahonii TaxID=3004105 RepID=UPI0026ED086D|nr:50S ribosomal protein L5 [Candidatus Mycoplasma mahonii]WKX02242.1 50S ribosomal protein L5 [Candidatus Mycoplasma mahonii]
MTNLQEKYNAEIKDALQKKFNYKSNMQIPKLEKIILNMTAGNEVTNSKAIEEVANELTIISGQKPIETKARKSLASWKLREGMPMGSKVTLRRDNMYSFFEKLIDVAIPRIRDFRGVNPKAFDGRGNFSLGIKEQIVFPEIRFDKIRKIKGLDVIVVTSAKTDDEARELLTLLGMPFKDTGKKDN